MNNLFVNISSSNLWTKCPYFMNTLKDEAMERSYSSSASSNQFVNYSDSGSVAHRIAEILLKRALKCEDYLQEELDNLYRHLPKDMNKYIIEYITYVTKEAKDAVYVGIEESVKDEFLQIDGRIDSYIVNDEMIEIIDFKTGKGKRVEPDNMQMILYAYCLGIKYPNIKEFKLTILQPSMWSEKSIWINRFDLFKRKEEANDAFYRWKLLLNSEEEFYRNPGTHCDEFMCPIKKTCSSYHAMNARRAAEILSSVGDIHELNGNELAELMTSLIYLQNTKESTSDEVVDRINHGQNVPGYKILAAKRVKKVNNESEVAHIMMELVANGIISPDEAFDLKSAVQLENCLPKTIYDDFVRDNIKIELTKPTLKKI